MDLGAPDSTASEGGRQVTINDAGQVAGTVRLVGEPVAARWTGPTYGAPEILNPLPGHRRSEATDINQSGQVTGASDSHAVRWTGTTPEALSPESQGVGFGINDSGQVTGYKIGNGRATAVRWDGTTPQQLDSLPGDTASAGYAINNAGQVTGVNFILGKNRAVRWDEANVVDLGLLPEALDSRGWDINAAGWVVGSSTIPLTTGGGIEHAILHDRKALYDLIDLIVGPNPFDHLFIAFGINDVQFGSIVGQIVGVGSVNSTITAYRLTPVTQSGVSEPTTLALLTFGMAALRSRCRRVRR